MKIVWVCRECNWVSVSDSELRHCMDTCRCGKCSMDLEDEYCRFIGDPITGPFELASFVDGKWINGNELK